MDGIGELLKAQLPEGLGLGFENLTPQEREQQKVDAYNATVGDLDKEDGYQCDICKNKGHVAIVTKNEQFGYYMEALLNCKCCRIRNAIRRLNRSGLKNRVKECTFERYEAQEGWQQTIKAKAQEFASSGGDDWFFIGGQSGAGKTHICTAAAIARLKQGKELRYMEWREEVPKIKASITEATKYAEMMHELKTVDVLYIDDLFKNGRAPDGNIALPTAADINLAFEIINYRCNQPELITIISSERTLAELVEIDEAVAGRIAQRSKKNGYCINLKRDSRKNWRMRGMVEL
jgi:DNA replication protein DnaC